MDAPFHFVPGVELDPASRVRDIRIKGSLPRLPYGFDLTELYPTIPCLAPDLAYPKIKAELDAMDRLLHGKHRVRNPQALPDVGSRDSGKAILALLDPSIADLGSLLRAAARRDENDARIIVPDIVRPFPLCNASTSKLLHTFGWIDANIKLQVEKIAKFHGLDDGAVRRVVEAALKLYCYFVKQDEYRLASTIGFNQSMFIQDRIVHLIFGDRVYWDADQRDAASQLSNRIAMDILRRMGESDPMRLAGLAVAIGVLWTSRADVQARYLQRPGPLLDDLASKLDELCFNWGIDDRPQFFKEVGANAGGHLVLVPDDNGESVFDLALFQSLLQLDPDLNLTIAVNRYPVSNNIARSSFSEILQDDLFSILRDRLESGHLRIVEERQLFPAFEPAHSSHELSAAMKNADLVYVKGVSFFEVFQPSTAPRYYGFVVSGQMSSLLSGFDEGVNVLARVPANRPGYIYLSEGEVTSLRELHLGEYEDAAA